MSHSGPSSLSGIGDKKPLKRFEIALNKFNEVAVPYHVDLLKKHKTNIMKLERSGQLYAAHREHINAGRAVQQLKALIYEIDNLRSQVRNEELDEFSKLTETSRQCVEDAIETYLAMEKPKIDDIKLNTGTINDDWPGASRERDTNEIPSLQIQIDEEAELKKKEAYLKSWEQLQNECKDLNQLVQDFAVVVHSQSELTSNIESHVETTQDNVNRAERSLSFASKFKAASYPMMGALIGGCMGGPIGLVAGLKVGGLAAIGGGLLGFTGGRFLKKSQITDVDRIPEEAEISNTEQTSSITVS